MESTAFDEEKQTELGISVPIHATSREKDEISCQENKWLSLNNDNKYIMDSVECAIRTGHSDNSNISGLRNLVVKPDFLSGSNDVLEYVTDEHTSLEIHSKVYSKGEKTATNVKEHISSKTDNNAVAGPSGMCPQKKTFHCKLYPKTFSENTFYSAQLWTPSELSYLDAISDIREINVQTKESAPFTASSENAESCYRPENDFGEAYNILATAMESTAFDEEKQRESGVSDLIHSSGREEDEMSRQESKWLSLNNDNKYFKDYSECAIRTGHSDNCNISGLINLVLNPDFLSGSNEPEKGTRHVSEFAIDEHTSLEIHSKFHVIALNLCTQSSLSEISSSMSLSFQQGTQLVFLLPRRMESFANFCTKELKEKTILFREDGFIRSQSSSSLDENLGQSAVLKLQDLLFCTDISSVKLTLVRIGKRSLIALSRTFQENDTNTIAAECNMPASNVSVSDDLLNGNLSVPSKSQLEPRGHETLGIPTSRDPLE
ncbi:hypothetical protein HNY73_009725 [Argiope bruennichi]|uniref:Uncharacterized protein n=1 Tax=Argiope bruennichi TaxID=94029 RepID=A0A8T0FAB1_ARGBR|nr:hypothetical protein HNY73_009725 [Argiope bruennichi]